MGVNPKPPPMPIDTVDTVLERLNKETTTEEVPSVSSNNSTSILGEKQSEEDFLAAYGLIKKKKD